MEPSLPNRIKLAWPDLYARLREVLAFAPFFLKNAVERIKRVPSWDWPTAFLASGAYSMITSVLSAIIMKRILSAVASVVLGPVIGILVSLFSAGVFYYLGLFALKTELEFRKVYVLVVLSMLPAQIIMVFSGLTRVMVPLGILAWATIFAIGFSENFLLEKKKVIRLVGAVAGLLLVFWIYDFIIELRSTRIQGPDITSESLNQLKEEFGQ
ncbi:MAG: YIP1 family protein [Oligoflexia bacterium]|nr:YIP1 family protein [Oligoflexia bacterium]